MNNNMENFTSMPLETNYGINECTQVIPTPGLWDKLHYHLSHIWCRDNEDDFHTLMAWFAHLVQHPKEKSPTTLLVSGGRGSGKSCLIWYVFEPILGHRYFDFNFRSQVGRFLSHYLTGKSLVSLDMPIWTGHKKECRDYQNLIKWLPSYTRLIHLTNDVIEPFSGKMSNNIFALSLNNEKVRDQAYFNALIAEINNGGREAFLYDLIHYEVKE